MTIPIRNLYYLFCYAWEKYPEYDAVDVGIEDCPDLVNLFARILVNGVNRLLRRGLDRRYLETHDELRSPRGRFLIDESLKAQTFERAAVVCRFDELSVDALHNQLIKATVVLLREDSRVEAPLAHSLRALEKRLAWISDIRVTGDLFNRVQLSRQNRQYSQLLRLCEFVWRVALPEHGGLGSRFGDILRDEARMSLIFELFLFNFFRLHAHGYSSGRENMRWRISDEAEGDRSLIPIMRTDLTLRSPQLTYVMDAKFYAQPFIRSLGGLKINSAHLFQLYAYMKHATDRAPETPVAGAIVYASPLGRSLNRYRLDGHDVTIATIDLSQPWLDIHSDLMALLDETSARVAA